MSNAEQSGGIPVAVVTGGARRIGREISTLMHHEGYDIALHCHSSLPAAEELAEELNGRRAASCTIHRADLAALPEVQRFASALVEQYSGISLLVNNASGFAPSSIESCTSEVFDHLVDSNLRGAFFLIQGLLPGLKRARGSVVNILDMHVARPLAGYSAYGAAKGGLATLTRYLAVELGPAIRVNAISPGAILWPEDDTAYDAAARLETIAQTPLQRMGDPSDIARAVRFLAMDAQFITGHNLTVDGGRSLV